MVKVQLYTRNAQLDLEEKIMELPESPLIGDPIFFGNLFNADEKEIASYEASKNGKRLEGIVTERTWYLDHDVLDYHLLLTLELKSSW